MIRLTDLHKSYRDGDRENHVLRGVSFEIAPGELVALMGTSGSGKTTLLNIIGAVDQDYTGEIAIAGQDPRKLGDKAVSRFRNQTVAFVFQQFHLLNHLPVIENVILPSWFDPKRSSAELHVKATEVLERVRLGHKLDATPNRLSGGEKQRVAIARAVFNNPKILLADEPTGALDSESGQMVLDIFGELNESDGITIVVVTHDRDVAGYCDRIIRIHDGTIVSDGADGPDEPARRAEGEGA